MEFQGPQIAPKVEGILGFHWLIVLHHLHSGIYSLFATNIIIVELFILCLLWFIERKCGAPIMLIFCYVYILHSSCDFVTYL
jgi:hypothetical protein